LDSKFLILGININLGRVKLRKTINVEINEVTEVIA